MISVLPVRLGIFPKRLSWEVLVRLGLRRDALRPSSPRSEKLGAGQHGLTFVQFSFQFLNLIVPVRQSPLQVSYPLLLQQQDLGKVLLEVAHCVILSSLKLCSKAPSEDATTPDSRTGWKGNGPGNALAKMSGVFNDPPLSSVIQQPEYLWTPWENWG